MSTTTRAAIFTLFAIYMVAMFVAGAVFGLTYHAPAQQIGIIVTFIILAVALYTAIFAPQKKKATPAK